MKAAVLNEFGAALDIQTLPDPVLGTGEVIVDVAAAGVAGYASAVFSGARNYLLELPVAPGPGGIGRVRATGPDSTKLSPPNFRSAIGSSATRRSARATRPSIPT
jgi:alcohol dehydrogenase